MSTKKETYHMNNKLWIGVATVAGIFAFVMSVLLIVNYLQMQSVDPLSGEIIDTLVERLNENPKDDQLREEIRALDLLARKAYFTSQRQIRAGGYFLLACIALIIISLQFIDYHKKIIPKVSDEKADPPLFTRKRARQIISVGGAAIVVAALVFAFITHNELEKGFRKASIMAVDDLDPDGALKNQSKEIIEEEYASADDDNESSNELDPRDLVGTMVAAKQVTGSFPSDREINANFPSFRGPGGNGVSYHKNIPVKWNGSTGENVLWKVAVPKIGYNSPVIWGDKLFLSGADENASEVYCFNRHTGELIWTGPVNNIPGSPATPPETTYDTGLAAPSLTTDGERVYAIFANGDIIAFNKDGNRLWARNLGVPGNHYGHSSSLIQYKNVILVQYDQKKSPRVIGLNALNGETLWETPRKVKTSWASPVLIMRNNNPEVVLVADPTVMAYNPVTGEEIWSISCMSGEVGPSICYDNGIVYAMNEYASLVAIKAGEAPGILWEGYDYLSDVPSPVIKNNLLFIPTSYGVLACFDATSGDLIWEQEFDKGFYSSPVIVGDNVYLQDKNGIMHIFKVANEYTVVGECPLGEKSVSTPAFADGRIYIRSDKNNLYCIAK